MQIRPQKIPFSLGSFLQRSFAPVQKQLAGFFSEIRLAYFRNIVRRNGFRTDRSLANYESLLGEEFSATIRALDQSGHWMDLGCGDARAAENIQSQRNVASIPWMSLFTYVWKSYPCFLAPDKVMLFSGRFFEDIPHDEFVTAILSHGFVDVASDVLGVMSYTTDPVLVLRHVLDVLAADGAYYVFVKYWQYQNETVEIDGEDELFWPYLIEELGLKIFAKHHESGCILKIQRSDKKIEWPELELLRTDRHLPPTRHFRLKKKTPLKT